MVKGRKPTRYQSRLDKKRKEEEKRKKQALAESEFKKKRKEQVEKMKVQEEKMKELEERRDRLVKYEVAYWLRVWESDGFDVEKLGPPPLIRMLVFKCEKTNDCPLLVRLYAKVGVHRYNMVQGTNLQLHGIEKYNRESWAMTRPASYCITLVAKDPATGSLIPFQVTSHEKSHRKMDVNFFIARPQNTGTKGMLWANNSGFMFHGLSAPEWPSEDDFADKTRFYLVPESKWQENDWIRLYLELAFVRSNRWRFPNPNLSDLKIVEVMLENTERVDPPNEILKGFRNLIVYIKYDHDLGQGRICQGRGIARRTVDVRTERMCLMGRTEDHPRGQATDSEHQTSF